MHEQSRRLRIVVLAALLGAVWPGAMHAAGPTDWTGVPDTELERMRGGLRIGELIGNFAIERIVRVDGQIVAQTQLVFDFANAKNGALPSLQVIGELASLIQVSQADSASVIASAEATHAAVESTAMSSIVDDGATDSIAAAPGSAVPVTASVTVPVPDTIPVTVAVPDTVPVPGQVMVGGDTATPPLALVGSDSSAQAGKGVDSTVIDSPRVALALPAVSMPVVEAAAGVDSVHEAAASMLPATTGAGTEFAAPSSIVRAVGNTGAVIVVSNLPDATALATAIQNQVSGTVIAAQTIISGSLSSLSHLQSGAFADSLRQQILQRGP